MDLAGWVLLALCILLVMSVGYLAYRVHGFKINAYAPPPSAEPEYDATAANVESLRRELQQAEELIDRMRNEATLQAARIESREREMALEITEEKQRLRAEFAESKREAAKLTAARSRVALVAKIAEHMAPLLSGFPYNFKEVRHVGEVFDFLVYKGLESGEIEEVVFLEIKSGTGGRRNPRERMLKRAVDAGRVRYEVFVPDTAGARGGGDGGLLEPVGADDDGK